MLLIALRRSIYCASILAVIRVAVYRAQKDTHSMHRLRGGTSQLSSSNFLLEWTVVHSSQRDAIK
jgi:hypothetical protein